VSLKRTDAAAYRVTVCPLKRDKLCVSQVKLFLSSIFNPFNESEFLVYLGLLLGSPECGIKGASLWQNGNGKLA
jgi:hypothetical protein